ncbi:MAG: transcription elongation factor GreA [Patescibacteria group bacterium]
MSSGETYLTKEGLLKLKEELEQLKKARKDIANRIQDAKELGDLSENAEYTEAKNAQAFNEGRIIDIENILKNASVIEENNHNVTEVQIGCRLKVEQDGHEQEFSIIGSSEADPSKGLISNESPLGVAFMNKKAGDVVEVEVPKGLVKYKIISIE